MNLKRANWRLGFGAAAVAVAVAALSCRHMSPDPGGIPVIRRPTWWNFYRRGLAYARAGAWEEALHDFRVATGRQEGAVFAENQEKRRAKTYGLHFLNDYFPHRESGICLYRLERLDEAEKALLDSVAMLSSSRALFYLNKVREARLRRDQAQAPAAPVRIEMDMGPEPLYVRDPRLRLQATVTSPALVAGIAINGRPLFIELANAAITIEEDLTLQPGRQLLRVEAHDLLGRTTTRTTPVVLDLRGPGIFLSRDAASPADVVVLSVTDDTGLSEVVVDDVPMPVQGYPPTLRRRLQIADRTRILVTAADRAGNRTQLSFRADDLRQARAGTPSTGPVGRLACSRWPCSCILTAARFAAADPVSTGAGTADTMGPRLRLFQSRRSVTSEMYCVDLQVHDSGGLDKIIFDLNGAREVRSLRQHASIVHRLTETFALSPGSNVLRIDVSDIAGNVSRRQLEITRRTNCLWREDLRMTLQLMPPQMEPGSPLRRIDLAGLLLESLLQAPSRFQVVERSPEVLERLLLELKLGESPLADYRRAVSTGRLKPAEWLLQGRLIYWSEGRDCELVVEIVDVATGETVLTTDIFFERLDRELVRGRLHGLVHKLEQQVPRISAAVAGLLGKGARIPLGRDDGIVPGMRFLFIPAAAPDPEFADPLTLAQAWVQGRVTQARDRECLVTVFPAAARDLVHTNDLAILR